MSVESYLDALLDRLAWRRERQHALAESPPDDPFAYEFEWEFCWLWDRANDVWRHEIMLDLNFDYWESMQLLGMESEENQLDPFPEDLLDDGDSLEARENDWLRCAIPY